MPGPVAGVGGIPSERPHPAQDLLDARLRAMGYDRAVKPPPAPPGAPPQASAAARQAAEARRAREAAALRANLSRRKRQARARAGGAADPKPPERNPE